MGNNPLLSPDPLRKNSSSNGNNTNKTNGNTNDLKDDLSKVTDQCNADADLASSYLNLENIFDSGGDNVDQEGSLEVRFSSVFFNLFQFNQSV